MKYLFLRRPIDVNQKNQLNFLPKLNEENYIIEGTQIIPIDESSNPDHVILNNFGIDDYQFRGELLNSGIKIYLDQHCQTR